MADEKKCAWYAEFEGVCTNGDCPYCADDCPISGELGVCRFDKDNNVPSKWIPVTERLPKDGEPVLWMKRIDKSQMIAKYDKRRNVWTDGRYYGGINGVTHWMPLPEPPKGE